MKKVFILVLSLVMLAMAAKKAPDFKLKNMENKSISLESLLEKGPVLVDFWASWCTPCKEEMPIFNDLYKTYHKDGLQMVLITIDNGSGIPKAKSFVRSSEFEFEVAFDKGGKVFKKYGGDSSVPVTFIINQQGEIIYQHAGKGTKEMFETEIKKVLKK